MYTVRARDESGNDVVREEFEDYFPALTRFLELKAEAVDRGYFYVRGYHSEYDWDLDEPLWR